METNLIESLEKAIGSSYLRYKGCLIEQKEGKFIALGKSHDTKDQARTYIDLVFANLKIVAA